MHKTLKLWREQGQDGLQPRSRRPKTNPNKTPDHVRQSILELRTSLLQDGLDGGPETIMHHLKARGITVSRSTIWRILKANGQVTPQPQKRPRSSWTKFNASRPNEMWQSDFTHIRLTDGTFCEVIGWLDDHSRFILHLSAHRRITGQIVIHTFKQTCTKHGPPTSTLTDNGNAYTTRYAGYSKGNKNGFETLPALQGITQKNGLPYKPTTQGKIERFWQTLKKWTTAHPAATIEELNKVLNDFATYYNHHRPHRAIARKTPAFAYQLIPKAQPITNTNTPIHKVRYDRIDDTGKISLRWAGAMRHLAAGRAYKGLNIICLIHNDHAQIINPETGQTIAEFTLDPNRGYQRKNT